MKCCDNCLHFDGTYCITNWNNADVDYLVPMRDVRTESECCEDWEGYDDDTEGTDQ